MLAEFTASDLDLNTPACEDFYQFANGGWLQKNPIPPTDAFWGVGNFTDQRVQQTLREIMESAASGGRSKETEDETKVGDYFSACMGTPAIEAAGIKPLEPLFERIQSIRNHKDLQDLIAQLHFNGISVLFNFDPIADFNNSSQVIAQASQGTLGLPDRDYYLKQDDKSQKIREAYSTHVERLFRLLNDNNPAGEAQIVMRVETRLADASLDRTAQRDLKATHNPMTRRQLAHLTPHFSWQRYYSDLHIPSVRKVNVEYPAFFETADELLATLQLSDWKLYLRWQLINHMAPYLSSVFVEEDFDFNSRILAGAQQMQPRVKLCIADTDNALGEALGKLYVKRAFSPEAKAKALEITKNLEATLRQRIATLDWMTPVTRKNALAKLDSLNNKIGYPDKWRDYSALRVDRGIYAADRIRASVFEKSYQLTKIGKRVNKNEWEMTPQTANAYYEPLKMRSHSRRQFCSRRLSTWPWMTP